MRKQYQRNRELFTTPTDDMPVFGTQAARFNDDGVTALSGAGAGPEREKALEAQTGQVAAGHRQAIPSASAPSFPTAARQLPAEIADAVRGYHAHTDEQAGEDRP